MIATKKYWLDGIFDNEVVEPFIVIKAVVIDQSALVVPDMPIVSDCSSLCAVVPSNTIILCSNYLYCNNASCSYRHWYYSRCNVRVERAKIDSFLTKRYMNMKEASKYYEKTDYCKTTEKEALERAIVRMKREGLRVIVR